MKNGLINNILPVLPSSFCLIVSLFLCQNIQAQCNGLAVQKYPNNTNNCATKELYPNFAGYPTLDLSKFLSNQTPNGTWSFISSWPYNPKVIGFDSLKGTFTISNATTDNVYTFQYLEPGCATPIKITVNPAPDLDMPESSVITATLPFDLRTLIGANAITMGLSLTYFPNGNNPIVTVKDTYTLKALKNTGCQSKKIVVFPITRNEVTLTPQYSAMRKLNYLINFAESPKPFQLTSPMSTESEGAHTAVLAENSNNEKAIVFPNPTSGDISVRLSLPLKGDLNLEIFNAAGQKVLTKKVDFEGDNALFTLSTSDLPTGNYVLTVKNGAKMLQYKFNKL